GVITETDENNNITSVVLAGSTEPVLNSATNGKIWGRIWEDVNGNGVIDTGEKYIIEPGATCAGSNSISVSGVSLIVTGPLKLITGPTLCYPDTTPYPYYNTDFFLTPGSYNIALNVPFGWEVTTDQKNGKTVQVVAGQPTLERFGIRRTSYTVKIKSVSSQKCLDIRSGDEYVVQNTCNNVASQNWKLENSGNGYQIKNVGNGKCIDIRSAAYNNQTPLISFGCHGGLNQQWTLKNSNANNQLISVAAPNYGIDIPNSATSDGAQAQIYFSHIGTNQQFVLDVAPLILNGQVNLKANGFDGPITNARGAAVNLTWTTSNIGTASCSASGAWDGSKPSQNAEGINSQYLTSDSVFTLTCGNVSDSVRVNVIEPTTTVNIKANDSEGPITVLSGGQATLKWTSLYTGVSSCVASGGAWSGTKSLNNLVGVSTGPITSTSIFVITCGNVSDSVIVNVSGASSDSSTQGYLNTLASMREILLNMLKNLK
ncbi:MAG: RICIN domain-containing protein, partial [bacterium]|nr:RICIN domain-containing protein [bacterium]